MLMELSVETNLSSDEWTKEELKLFLALAVEGKGRREISKIMELTNSEIVHAALKYSIVLPA